jgi:splicing factor 3A subunit 3
VFIYLEGFIKRVKPLTDLSRIFADLETKFEEDWSLKRVPGWAPEEESDDKSLYCAACNSLHSPLFSFLLTSNVKPPFFFFFSFFLVGVKNFAKQTVYDAHLKGKKHIKAAELLATNKIDVVTQEKLKAQREDGRDKQFAWLEVRITKMAELLGEERENTKSNIERKQARGTTAERDEDAEVEDDGESESDDEDRPYNPLNLPLGWDGKPIPYWLYKLHGLGVEYKCEICGNYTYMGRKPFERHFTVRRNVLLIISFFFHCG